MPAHHEARYLNGQSGGGGPGRMIQKKGSQCPTQPGITKFGFLACRYGVGPGSSDCGSLYELLNDCVEKLEIQKY
jgi:hypothetical protein